MIIRRFSLLWEDVLWQVLNVCSNYLSPHFTTNLRWHFSCFKCSWRYFRLITPYSTSEFITSEYWGIKLSALPMVTTSDIWCTSALWGQANAPQALHGPRCLLGTISTFMWAFTVPHCPSAEADPAGDPHIPWQPAWAQVSWAGSVIWAEFMWLPTDGLDRQHPASPVFYMSKTIHFPPCHCSCDAEKPNLH